MTFVTKFSNSEISASLGLSPGAVSVDPDLDPRIDVLRRSRSGSAVAPVRLPERVVAALTVAVPVVVVTPTVAASILDHAAVDIRPAVDVDAGDPRVAPAPVHAMVEGAHPVVDQEAEGAFDVAGGFDGIAA